MLGCGCADNQARDHQAAAATDHEATAAAANHQAAAANHQASAVHQQQKEQIHQTAAPAATPAAAAAAAASAANTTATAAAAAAGDAAKADHPAAAGAKLNSSNVRNLYEKGVKSNTFLGAMCRRHFLHHKSLTPRTRLVAMWSQAASVGSCAAGPSTLKGRQNCFRAHVESKCSHPSSRRSKSSSSRPPSRISSSSSSRSKRAHQAAAANLFPPAHRAQGGVEPPEGGGSIRLI